VEVRAGNIHSPQAPPLKKNLSEVEQQLAESMLRNSSVLEALRNDQH